jgi:hypothetical protein
LLKNHQHVKEVSYFDCRKTNPQMNRKEGIALAQEAAVAGMSACSAARQQVDLKNKKRRNRDTILYEQRINE